MAAKKTIMFPIVLPTTGDAEEQNQQNAAAAEAEHRAAGEEEIVGKRKEMKTQIESLSNNILEEILSRIHTKTVVGSKILSKPWFSMVDHPVFALTHFSRQPVSPLLLATLYFPGINNDDVATTSAAADVTSRFAPVNSNVVSCEGIVCWALYHSHSSVRIFLSNPITSDCFVLDPPPNESDTVYVFIRLGFVPRTKKFELLRMSRTGAKNSAEVAPWVSEVFTLGVPDPHWRQVRVATLKLDLAQTVSEVIYVNGALYWRYIGDSSICSFNFNTRVFQYIRIPQMNLMLADAIKDYFDSKTMSMGVLANSLCVSLFSVEDGHVSLWVLETHSINSVDVDQLIPWSKVCDMDSHTTSMDYTRMMGWREILMHDWRETFLIYEPITGRERVFRALEHSSIEEMRTSLHV
ncbi:hypothetical protein MIMGU_mgv1a026116mg [Erythranthe guttata]|uniref:F-box associated beta-propeller type 3 domain-containing protein n=1 Tax=Erythranthe guttata TaxID=4155 RepID=A0A022REN4_ERYGU|nr:hypothetical protein MIMGU_mgv1a026116mg [Erythranthe guttata]